MDIAQPLAVIVEAAYVNDPKQCEDARFRLKQAISLTRQEELAIPDQHEVLKQLLDLATVQGTDPLIGSPSELSELIKNHFDIVTPQEEISATLRHYGFTKKSRRKDGQPAYRYVVPKAKLAEILERYGAKEVQVGEPQREEMPEVPGQIGDEHARGSRCSSQSGRSGGIKFGTKNHCRTLFSYNSTTATTTQSTEVTRKNLSIDECLHRYSAQANLGNDLLTEGQP